MRNGSGYPRKSLVGWAILFGFRALLLGLSVPYVLLVVLSLGSGWSFPNLLPDRLDFAPWRNFWTDRDGLFQAAMNSVGISVTVSSLSTCAGLLSSRSLQRLGQRFWFFVAYLPFVLSPVIVGVALLDLFIRLGLASTFLGVITVQFIFAFAFATVFFCETWDPGVVRSEQLVAMLGGRTWHVFRHAMLPRLSGLIAVCWLQTALFSWLDYGLVSVIGGGRVRSLTLMLFAYLRESSVNQAALAGIVLLVPPLIFIFLAAYILHHRRDASAQAIRSPFRA